MSSQHYGQYGGANPAVQPQQGYMMNYGHQHNAPHAAGIPAPVAARPLNQSGFSQVPAGVHQKLSMGGGQLIAVHPGQAPPPGAILVGPAGQNNFGGAPMPFVRPSAVPAPAPQMNQSHAAPSMAGSQIHAPSQISQAPTPPTTGNAVCGFGSAPPPANNPPQPQRSVAPTAQYPGLGYAQSNVASAHPGVPQQSHSLVPGLVQAPPPHFQTQQMNLAQQQQQQQPDYTPQVRQMETLLEQASSFCASLDEHERRLAAQRTELMQAIHSFKKELSAVAAQSGKGPAHPREPRSEDPPFYWTASPDYMQEFAVSGAQKDVVTKVGDFEDQGWVIPVAGSLKMVRGSVYRWGLKILRKCPHRPQLQFGIHGLHHEKPWRLITTSRCSRSRDDEPWQDRPEGDRLIEEGNIIWVEVDMRVLGGSTRGTLSYAVNEEPWEVAFADIPLNSELPLVPVVSMGGDGCAVQVLPF